MSKKWLKKLPFVIGLLLIVLAVGGGLYLKKLLFKDQVEQKKMVQQITVITPPPPPPPPPPEMEEPEVEEEVVEEELDEPLPDESLPDEAPAEQLGLDAEGSAGADGFGLAARKGGRGLLGSAGYGGTVKSEINKALIKDEQLRHLEYEAIVTLWIEDDGSFARFDIDLVKGGESIERELRRFFAQMAGVGRPKPLEEEASQFRFRISSVI